MMTNFSEKNVSKTNRHGINPNGIKYSSNILQRATSSFCFIEKYLKRGSVPNDKSPLSVVLIYVTRLWEII